MSEEKRRFKTIIASRPYTILANKPEEHLKLVSQIANEQITQIKSAMPQLDIEQRSVLVAVNAISESISRQAEINELKKYIAELEKGKEPTDKMTERTLKEPAQANPVTKKTMTVRRPPLPVNSNLTPKRSHTQAMPSASKEKLLNKSGEIGKR